MEFNSNKPIYLQISDSICEKILSGEYPEEGRILSVRELGAEIGVNPNTIMRTYEELERKDIIFNKRGIGYFVSEGAVSLVRKALKKDFLENELPSLFKTMKLLNVSVEDMTSLYEKYLEG